ncbi:hypothetical protein RI367_004413 [Sorochytrium milnesiophthora]
MAVDQQLYSSIDHPQHQHHQHQHQHHPALLSPINTSAAAAAAPPPPFVNYQHHPHSRHQGLLNNGSNSAHFHHPLRQSPSQVYSDLALKMDAQASTGALVDASGEFGQHQQAWISNYVDLQQQQPATPNSAMSFHYTPVQQSEQQQQQQHNSLLSPAVNDALAVDRVPSLYAAHDQSPLPPLLQQREYLGSNALYDAVAIMSPHLPTTGFAGAAEAPSVIGFDNTASSYSQQGGSNAAPPLSTNHHLYQQHPQPHLQIATAPSALPNFQNALPRFDLCTLDMTSTSPVANNQQQQRLDAGNASLYHHHLNHTDTAMAASDLSFDTVHMSNNTTRLHLASRDFQQLSPLDMNVASALSDPASLWPQLHHRSLSVNQQLYPPLLGTSNSALLPNAHMLPLATTPTPSTLRGMGDTSANDPQLHMPLRLSLDTITPTSTPPSDRLAITPISAHELSSLASLHTGTHSPPTAAESRSPSTKKPRRVRKAPPVIKPIALESPTSASAPGLKVRKVYYRFHQHSYELMRVALLGEPPAYPKLDRIVEAAHRDGTPAPLSKKRWARLQGNLHIMPGRYPPPPPPPELQPSSSSSSSSIPFASREYQPVQQAMAAQQYLTPHVGHDGLRREMHASSFIGDATLSSSSSSLAGLVDYASSQLRLSAGHEELSYSTPGNSNELSEAQDMVQFSLPRTCLSWRNDNYIIAPVEEWVKIFTLAHFSTEPLVGTGSSTGSGTLSSTGDSSLDRQSRDSSEPQPQPQLTASPTSMTSASSLTFTPSLPSNEPLPVIAQHHAYPPPPSQYQDQPTSPPPPSVPGTTTPPSLRDWLGRALGSGVSLGEIVSNGKCASPRATLDRIKTRFQTRRSRCGITISAVDFLCNKCVCHSIDVGAAASSSNLMGLAVRDWLRPATQAAVSAELIRYLCQVEVEDQEV